MSLTGNVTGKRLRGKITLLRKMRGYSAYEIAVGNGFDGTEEEWLASLDAQVYVQPDEPLDAVVGALWVDTDEQGEEDNTPIKGKDYFTEADKQEMVNSVLSYFTDVTEVGM